MTTSHPAFLIFDVESVADGELVSKLRYPTQGFSPREAVAHYRAELMEKFENDFIPYTYQYPVSVAVAKVAVDFHLIDVVALDSPEFRPHSITEKFWRGWEKYERPTLVTFNGRTFDLPLLELAAFRFGVSVKGWFDASGPSYEHHRNRYNQRSHLDLYDLLTNFSASRFSGGLNLAANLLGKPGKMNIQGHMVQDLFDAGQLAHIQDYCRCDVLDTYFVFLRSRVLVGQLTIQREQEIVAETKHWISAASQQTPAYASYLERWGDWNNPWDRGEDRPLLK